MKKAGIIAVLGVVVNICGSGALWAAPPAIGTPASTAQVTPTPGKFKVAVVNLHEVLKNYKKFTAMQDQFKVKAKVYEDQLKAKAERLDVLEKEYKKPESTQQRKDQIEGEAKSIKFEMDDIKGKAQKDLVKLQNEQYAIIYREVESVVTEYARQNGIDMVFRYSEDWGDDYNKPENVVRRLNISAIWPMYFDKSLDITAQVVDVMNKKYAAATPATGITPVSVPPK